MKQFFGSICLTDLLENAKKGNPAFSRSNKNNKIYVNCRIFIGDSEDKYGNSASIMTNLKIEEKENSFYFGNFKMSKDTGNSSIEAKDVDVNENDLPF